MSALLPRAVKRPELQWRGRLGSWRESSVQVVAVLWARFRVHLRGLALRKAVGSLRGQLAEALAAEAYALAEGDEIEAPLSGPVAVCTEDFGHNGTVAVALVARSSSVAALANPLKKLTLRGRATATWVDTIDTSSSKYLAQLQRNWNPRLLEINSAALLLPARWLFPSNPPALTLECKPGTHWHDFARVFGEVNQVKLTWQDVKSKQVMLVMHFTTPRSAQALYEVLAGRCLYNPLAADVAPVPLTFANHAKRFARAGPSRGQVAPWSDEALGGLLAPSSQGPVFELRLLEGRGPARICLAPWRPGPLTVGRLPGSDLALPCSAVSTLHAELILAEDGCVRVLDRSSNGTFLNGEQLRKGTPTQLKEGDVISFSENAQRPGYVFLVFETLAMAKLEALKTEVQEFQVPSYPKRKRAEEVSVSVPRKRSRNERELS